MQRIYFMLAYARKPNGPVPFLSEVLSRLTAAGFDVMAGVAESLVIRPETLRVEADLYVLKSHSSLWVNLAAVLDAQGAHILNPYDSCVCALNKIMTAQRLAAADIPIPRSWVTGNLAQLQSAGVSPPLLLKPNNGGRGKGIQFVRDAADLSSTPLADGTLVQEMVESKGEELKLYVIGDRVFVVAKDRADNTPARRPLTRELECLALRCGRALGLRVYGVDIIQGPAGPVVIDVNYFPSFVGVAEAPMLLADYIARYARAALPELALRKQANG